MTGIQLKSVRKSFQGFEVIHGIDLEIADGSFTVFVGPSGCGKSTLLRMMAGLEEMKRAMWKVDPSGQFRFSDREAGMTTLFGEDVNTAPLAASLRKHFAGQQVTIEEVHKYVLTKTIFGPDHYRRAVLLPLERSGAIEVVTSSRKKANGYPPGTVLRFT